MNKQLLQTNLTQRITELHNSILDRLQRSLRDALEIGDLLQQQKAVLAHGEFTPWIENELPFTPRTARRYIALYEHRDKLQSQNVNTLTEAYRLLQEPKTDTVSDLLNQVDNRLPENPAEFVLLAFDARGREPGHDPYPEERLPEEYSPPVSIQGLPIENIIDDSRTDHRMERNLDIVHWYAEIFEVFPPIAVFKIDEQHILADGRYRVAAANFLQRDTIECRIYTDECVQKAEGIKAPILYSVAANAAQGLPLETDNHERRLQYIKKKGMSRDELYQSMQRIA